MSAKLRPDAQSDGRPLRDYRGAPVRTPRHSLAQRGDIPMLRMVPPVIPSAYGIAGKASGEDDGQSEGGLDH